MTEPFVELVEVGAGRLGVAFEAGPQPLADVIEALRHHPRHVGLARAQPFAHRAEAPGELGVGLQNRGDARLELALAFFRRFRLAPARRARARQRHDEGDEQQRDRAERAAERLAEGDGSAVEDDEDLVHGGELSRFAGPNRTKEEHV